MVRWKRWGGRCARGGAVLRGGGERGRRPGSARPLRARDGFPAVVSPGLRTPLNAIRGWSRMMTAARLPDAERERAVQTIERNAVAQAKLIDELLDVSRITRGAV